MHLVADNVVRMGAGAAATITLCRHGRRSSSRQGHSRSQTLSCIIRQGSATGTINGGRPGSCATAILW